MPKTKPYEQFGSYLLFKRLETDALGDLWRAGRLDGQSLGPVVALRRLSGGNREALVASVAVAKPVAPLLTGASFVREQTIDTANGIPLVAWDYAGGRSLRHVVEKARGGTAPTRNPIPLDQAIIIADHVALSLATMAELRYSGDRLAHGALIPHFVWITDDGEIRVAGQQLGQGLIASLGDEKVAAEIGPYMSTEYQHSGIPTNASEVFALGAIFYLTLTGHEPPDATRASAFVQAIRGAKLMTGDPVPDDVRQILEQSLNLDPAARYASVADMKQALSAAASRYGSTSFNLAFYLSNLLKKEMESEALDREREAKTNVLPYFEVSATPPAPLLSVGPAKTRSRAPLAMGAAVVVVALAVGGWLTLGSKKAVTAAPAHALASAAPPVAPKPALVPEPIVASSVTETAPVPTRQAPIDEATRKKAFEDAVQQKLNEEMMKLQAAYTRQLQQQQARNAPVAAAPPPAPAPVTTTVAEERGPSAAQLDQQRRETQRAEAEEPVLPTQTVAAVTTPAPVPVPAPAPAALAAPVATVREGDVVDLADLDTAPHRTRDPRVAYPPMAARQRIETNVMTSVLVGETGEVLDVKILRGDSRYGFNDAALRALRSARYTSPMKDGKRVKTWLPQMVQFKP